MAKKATGHGGTRTDITTIEAMEAECVSNADGLSAKRIRGEWLEVYSSIDVKPPYKYKWGLNFVSREVAKSIMETA